MSFIVVNGLLFFSGYYSKLVYINSHILSPYNWDNWKYIIVNPYEVQKSDYQK